MKALTAAATRSSTSASSERGTIRRVVAEQVWPLLTKQPRTAAATAASRSAPSASRKADLPPSSSATFLMVPAADLATSMPAPVDPVRLTMSTCGWDESTSPTRAPRPETRLKTPAGRPSPSTMSASVKVASGATLLGFTTTVQPAASAGPTLAASW